ALLAVPERGRELRDELELHRARVRAESRKGPHPRALLVFGLDPLVVAGPRGFAGELLRDTGAINVAPDSDRPFPRMSVEAAGAPGAAGVGSGGSSPPRGPPPPRGLPGARSETLRPPAPLHPGPRLSEGRDVLVAARRGKRPP